MRCYFRPGLLVLALLLSSAPLRGQGNPPPVPPAGSSTVPNLPPLPGSLPPPPAASAVAATVNGHNIMEIAVYRATVREAPARHAEARKEVINFLVENALVDQYLAQMKIQVDAKEIDAKIDELKGEAKKEGKDFVEVLKKAFLTEEEVRVQLLGALRWDKFFAQQAPDV